MSLHWFMHSHLFHKPVSSLYSTTSFSVLPFFSTHSIFINCLWFNYINVLLVYWTFPFLLNSCCICSFLISSVLLLLHIFWNYIHSNCPELCCFPDTPVTHFYVTKFIEAGVKQAIQIYLKQTTPFYHHLNLQPFCFNIFITSRISLNRFLNTYSKMYSIVLILLLAYCCYSQEFPRILLPHFLLSL